jgi:hypothetical protein
MLDSWWLVLHMCWTTGSLPHLLYPLVIHPPIFCLVSEVVYMDSYPVQTNALPYFCLCAISSFQICVHVILDDQVLSPA